MKNFEKLFSIVYYIKRNTFICLYFVPLIFLKKIWRVNLVSAIDLPLVQAGMHRLYTGHITHRTRFGIKYYAKNVVPVFA